MKVIVDIIRSTKIKTKDVLNILGLDSKNTTITEANDKLVSQFGPLAPNFKTLWTDVQSEDLIVGIGVFQFDMSLQYPIGSNQSSLFHYMDDMNVEFMNRVDGALFSELNRIGIFTEIEKYSFKSIMKVEGN